MKVSAGSETFIAKILLMSFDAFKNHRWKLGSQKFDAGSRLFGELDAVDRWMSAKHAVPCRQACSTTVNFLSRSFSHQTLPGALRSYVGAIRNIPMTWLVSSVAFPAVVRALTQGGRRRLHGKCAVPWPRSTRRKQSLGWHRPAPGTDRLGLAWHRQTGFHSLPPRLLHRFDPAHWIRSDPISSGAATGVPTEFSRVHTVSNQLDRDFVSNHTRLESTSNLYLPDVPP